MSPVALFDLVEREAACRVGWLTVPQVREARAAVAELVEAAKNGGTYLDAQGNPTAFYNAAQTDRLRAALAKFGGAA